MSVNIYFSPSSNFSLDSTPTSSLNISSFSCFELTVTTHMFMALSASYVVFFLPLSIFIFYLSLQQCRKQRTGSAVKTSNSDVFTYNIIAMEFIGILGGFLFCYGCYTNQSQIKMVGSYSYNVVTPGEMLFHTLTSVERYLAVIHPVIYLNLRKAGAVRLRNISTVFIWVVSSGCVVLRALCGLIFTSTLLTILTIISVIVTSFCSLYILCALNRPGPGEAGGNRERVDQSKKRAFQTITIITGALLLKLGGDLLCILVEVTGAPSGNATCAALIIGRASSIPCSYVMPLLFLHRAGKLSWCKHNTETLNTEH